MRRSSWTASMTMLVLSNFPVAHCASLDVYGRLPSLEDMALSPDGTRLAFVRTEADTRVIAAYSLADHKVVGGLRLGQQKLRRIQWADEDHLLIYTSQAAEPIGLTGPLREWFMLQVFDVKTGRQRVIPGDRPFSNTLTMNVVMDYAMVRHVNGHTLLFVKIVIVGNPSRPALERLDLTAGGERLIREGGQLTQQWLVDADGELAAEQDYEEESGRWSLKVRLAGHMQDVAGGTDAIDIPRLLGFGPEADTILEQHIEQGEPVWRLLSLKDGTLGAPMAERASLESPIEAANPPRMIGGVHMADEAHYVFFDPGMQLRWDTVASSFPGEQLRLISHDSELLRLVVKVDGPNDGYKYFLMDMQTRQLQALGDVYEGNIKPFEVRRITYPAADGLNIPAYLTLPRDREAHNLPLIVLPHGGPQARDTADFDWWSQALADQGYAVLRPNYRGSALTGKFIAAGYGQWGRKMQTDLSDGVRYLARQGLINPARVCIAGASYGGYAALAGVSLDPGVYRCAVSVAGVSDLSQLLEWVERIRAQANTREERYWDRYMGASGPHDSSLDAISPVKHLDAISVPVLLVHGKDDTVVPYEQSQVMYDAMRHANKSVEFVTLKHEDHWLSRSETRLQMLQASVAFLREHNPPD